MKMNKERFFRKHPALLGEARLEATVPQEASK
jgi:hypothetical protein